MARGLTAAHQRVPCGPPLGTEQADFAVSLLISQRQHFCTACGASAVAQSWASSRNNEGGWKSGWEHMETPPTESKCRKCWDGKAWFSAAKAEMNVFASFLCRMKSENTAWAPRSDEEEQEPPKPWTYSSLRWWRPTATPRTSKEIFVVLMCCWNIRPMNVKKKKIVRNCAKMKEA